MLFSNFIVWYLFLGGTGAGLFLVTFFSCSWMRSSKPAYDAAGAPVNIADTLWRPALFGSLIILTIGCICLTKDLANASNLFALMASPSFSAIAIGAYALAGLLVCLIALIAFDTRKPHSKNAAFLHSLVVWIAVALAFVVALYTGVFLASMRAVPLWNSWTIPILFVLSAVSSGIAAIIILATFFTPESRSMAHVAKQLMRIDAVVVICEILALIAFVLQANANPVAEQSLMLLLHGDLALAFWIGFAGCGLALPLVAELAISFRLSGNSMFFVVFGCLILTGAFFLRFCIVASGVHLSEFMFV